MRLSVKNAFFPFTVKREGFTPYLYADTLNLVSSGVGNLLDAGPQAPPSAGTSAVRARLNNVVSAAAMAPALGLPWKIKGPNWNPDPKNPVLDTRGDATRDQVIAAWIAVKTQNEKVPDFSQRGGGSYKSLTNITLDMKGLMDLFQRTLDNFDRVLSRDFRYDTWPADAQLALLSMAWGMGPNFRSKFPQFSAAVDARDFNAAAIHSFFKGGGGTLEKPAGRNAENIIMFHNAAIVEGSGGDRETLTFPVEATPMPGLADVAKQASSILRTIEVGTTITVTGGILYGAWRFWKGRKS